MDPQQFRAELEKMGEALVRKKVASHQWNAQLRQSARQWLAECEGRRAREDRARAQEERELTRAAAEATVRQADAASEANRISRIALRISGLSLLVALAGAVMGFVALRAGQ